MRTSACTAFGLRQLGAALALASACQPPPTQLATAVAPAPSTAAVPSGRSAPRRSPAATAPPRLPSAPPPAASLGQAPSVQRLDPLLALHEPVGAAVLSEARTLMATRFVIAVAGVKATRARPAMAAAFAEIARIETLLSEWQPQSAISRINAAAGGEAVAVDAETLQVVQAGLEVSRWSDGAFDLSWAALRGLYRFDAGWRAVPGAAQIAQRRARVNWRRVEVQTQQRRVRLPEHGMALGTGAIAKGYALDRAAQLLRQAGLKHYLLYAGGQVLVRGRRGARPWRVGIQHPRQPRHFAVVQATAGSIATSGDYEHFFIADDGRRWHHIIDPRSGLPARGCSSVTVRATSGMHADALATAAFVLGPADALRMLAMLPIKAAALIVDHQGGVHLSPGLERQVVFTERLSQDGYLRDMDVVATGSQSTHALTRGRGRLHARHLPGRKLSTTGWMRTTPRR
ncbi:MAG: FAD:protein FMN transferase [Polyangiales bacterium]